MLLSVGYSLSPAELSHAALSKLFAGYAGQGAFSCVSTPTRVQTKKYTFLRSARAHGSAKEHLYHHRCAQPLIQQGSCWQLLSFGQHVQRVISRPMVFSSHAPARRSCL